MPLFHSILYLKEWIQQEHPTGSNLDSWLFVTIGKKQYSSKLSHHGLGNRYDYYKKKYFPSLLDNTSIPAPDARRPYQSLELNLLRQLCRKE